MLVMMRWTYCMPVMMRGPIVASYDERTYCMPVMMRWTYCMPVMMRGPIVC